MSRWAFNSSSTSLATDCDERRRYQNGRRRGVRWRFTVAASAALEHGVDRPRVSPPIDRLFAQALAAGRRQLVVARAAVVLRLCPLRLHQALPVEPVQRLIQRGVFNGEIALRP